MRPITASEISCFQRCEREWQHRYLENRDALVPAETLNRGKRMHVALAEWWTTGIMPRISDPAEHAMLWGYDVRYEQPHLSRVRVNVPWRATIGGVDVCGELDAIGFGGESAGIDIEKQIILEHKTTSSDIAPGSLWWREKVTTDIQLSMYQAAFPAAKILVDVLRVPDFEQLRATPEEQRKYTKPKYESCLPCRGKGSYPVTVTHSPETMTCAACGGTGKKVIEVSRLYANQRAEDETDEEFVARCLEDMSEKPEKYFQRAFVVRLETEHKAFEHDLQRIASRMQVRLQTPRNPRSCFSYGRQCDFFAACWEGKSIEDYPQREMNHSEEVASRV